jgi:Dolichyl-phosphate-mannose-protein mannosyltransferase
MPARTITAYATLAAGTLLVAVLLHYPSLFEPRWYGDEGIFAAVAENIRHGQTLYADAWDNKPPLIFFTYAAIQAAFGAGIFPLHLVATISVLTTQLSVMAIALLLFGARRSLVAGLIFAVAMGTPLLEANLAMTETFMILPASLAVLVYLLAERRAPHARTPWYTAVGFLLGIAASYKQVAVFDAAAIAVMIWLTHDRPVRPLATIAAGFALPQIALAAYFLVVGAFPQYWYAIVGSLGVYARLAPAQSPFARFAGLLPALLACAWLVRRRQIGREVRLTMFPVLWLGFAVAGATSSSFPFPHYLQQAMPALALVLVADPLAQEGEHVGKIALAVGAVLVTAVVFAQFAFEYRIRTQLDPVDYYRTFIHHRYGDLSDDDYVLHFDGKVFTARDITAGIKRDGAGSTLYTWGELPWIYADAGVTNPARYYTSFLGEFIPGAKADILRDLNAHPPVYIGVSDEANAPFEELDAFVAARYTLIESGNDWRLYRVATATGRLTPQPSGAIAARATGD